MMDIPYWLAMQSQRKNAVARPDTRGMLSQVDNQAGHVEQPDLIFVDHTRLSSDGHPFLMPRRQPGFFDHQTKRRKT
jgi:hypothetical protein